MSLHDIKILQQIATDYDDDTPPFCQDDCECQKCRATEILNNIGGIANDELNSLIKTFPKLSKIIIKNSNNVPLCEHGQPFALCSLHKNRFDWLCSHIRAIEFGDCLETTIKETK
jgi:hypothetical protein